MRYNCIGDLWKEVIIVTKAEIANKVIEESDGIASTSAFIGAGLSKGDLCKLVADDRIVRVQHGFYRLSGDWNVTEAEYLSKLFPEAIVCVESALFHYGYIDFVPRRWTVAVPRMESQTKIKNSSVPIKAYYIQPDEYDIGKTKDSFDGKMLSIYDRERTVCDCFKYRSKLDEELFAKALNAYANDIQKNLANLSKYSKQLRVYKKVFEIMGVLLNA